MRTKSITPHNDFAGNAIKVGVRVVSRYDRRHAGFGVVTAVLPKSSTVTVAWPTGRTTADLGPSLVVV